MSLGSETARTLRVIAPLGATPTAAQELELIAGSGVTLTGVRVGARLELTVAASGGGGSGDVVGPSSSVASEIVLFDGTTGKLLKRATTTGILKGTSGVLSAATAGTDYYAPGGTDVAVADGGTGASTAAGARTNLGLGSIATETATSGGDLAGTWPSPTVTQARGLRETSGPTTLAMGAVADGQMLRRSGSTIIGVYIVLAHLLPAQSGPYNVLTPTGQHATFTGSTWV